MSVIINFKICDNAEECNGIAVCPTGALAWDEKNSTIIIDNSKCISCGLCEKFCMVHAIKVAHTEEEYQEIEKEIADDPRKVTDLYLDRYGAQPILPAFLIKEDKFDTEVIGSSKIVVSEFFDNDSIMCMLRSIPIKELFTSTDIKYRKVEVGERLMKKYDISELPALVFFKEGKLLGKVEGYFERDQKDELIDKINKIIAS